MSPSGKERESREGGDSQPVKLDTNDNYISLQASLSGVKDSVERLAKTVAELSSRVQASTEVLKWVLNTLSQKSEDKDLTYLKNIEASTELVRSFMAFLETRVKPFAEVQGETTELASNRKEAAIKEPSKKEDDYLVRPSMVRRLQEEDGKGKDKKSQ